jgi:hypothetical protein
MNILSSIILSLEPNKKFYFDNKPWYIYSFGHSLWHFLIGLGLYYYYSICDSQILYNEYGEIELL